MRFCALVLGLLACAVAVLLMRSPPQYKHTPHPNAADWSGGARGAADDGGTPHIVPFKAHVDEAVLADLKNRLQHAKLPPQSPASTLYGETTWYAGVNAQALRDATAYWRDEFDWRAVEEQLNAFPQYKLRLRGLDIHFIHALGTARGEEGQACTVRPLLLLHGWPGSVLEFLDLIPKLTACTVDGGVSLSVVAPSMPGYGWSDPALVPGLSSIEIGSLYTELMPALGYEKYYVQGGDWGGMVGRTVAQIAPEDVLGFHANFLPFFPPPLWGALGALAPSTILGEDAPQFAPVSTLFKHILDHSGYFHEQSTRPDTIGAALSASPVSLLAWHLEKFRMWTDSDDDTFLEKFSMKELLTHIAVYWVTDTATTSMRLYHETMHDPNFWTTGDASINVPLAYADFPHEITRSPEAFLRVIAPDLVQYTRMPRGGHFAAFEQPQLLADDVLAFIRTVEARPPPAEADAAQ